MPTRRIPCTLLLPLFSLTLFATLVAIPASLNYLRLKQPDPTQIVPNQSLSPTETLLAIAGSEPEPFADLLNGIDVPANFVELPVDRVLPSWPDTWTPGDLDVFAWRAITFPIYSLPFWWFAGLGLDVLLKRRDPRRVTLIIGTILFALFLLLEILIAFTHGVETDRAVNIPIQVGELLWTVLFCSFPAAWIRNRLQRAPNP